MTAICECNHHKWSHYAYFNDIKPGENDNCTIETCSCVEYTPREFNIDDRKYPCREALTVRLALEEEKIHHKLRLIAQLDCCSIPRGLHCPICYYYNCDSYHLNNHKHDLEAKLETRLEDLVARYAFLKEFDKNQVRQGEQIKLKLNQSCKMFRCLKCWRLILPDDDMEEFGDGYVHRICLKIRLRVNDGLDSE